MTEVQCQPFLRWAGSKRKLLHKLAPYWNDQYDRYIEPFVGSACLFFRIAPKKAILSDINQELISTYNAVSASPRAVFNRLVKIQKGKRSYYRMRSISPVSLPNLDRAARFIFLNRFCFNGLYRTNLQGAFNVPFCPSRTGDLPNWSELWAAAKQLRNASLFCRDFGESVSLATRGDFVYLDPPYAVENRRVFREYGANCFGSDDLPRLNELLQQIHTNGAHFVLSYADCSEARSNFRHWETRRVFTHRNIAGFSRHRRRAVELLISNLKPVVGQS